MTIKIDYYIKQDGHSRIMHHEVTDSEILEDLKKKFMEGELPCPSYFNREECTVEFVIDSVTV